MMMQDAPAAAAADAKKPKYYTRQEPVPVKPGKRLTQAQVDQFNKDGWIFISGQDFWTQEELADFKKACDDVTQLPETAGKWMQYYQKSRIDGSRLLQRVENFLPYNETLHKLVSDKDSKVLGAVSELFGETSCLYKEKINFKFPGSDGFEPHQDAAAGWDSHGHDIHISVMVAIDECTKENGCLDMVRGAHKRGIIGKMFAAVPEDECAKMNWEPAPAQPGDLCFFDSFVPHRSAPNATDKSRRVLYATFNKLSQGDYREQYYADKRLSFPPDIERKAGIKYEYKI